jgi:hypothetical protein
MFGPTGGTRMTAHRINLEARMISRTAVHGVLMLLMLIVSTAAAQESPHGPMKIECGDCHTAASWKTMAYPSRFDPGKTGFALVGQHALVKCVACHSSLKFAGASDECADCHTDVHRAELGSLCERCHSSQSWVIPDMVQKHAQTRFALVGAHAAVNCDMCHTSREKYRYVGLRSDCYSCHAATYEATTSPNHRSVGFSTDCVQCHAVTALRWEGTFDHARTNFPLTGAHRAIPCVQCHPGGSFTSAPTQCVGCHLTDFNNTTNPPHSSGFSTECQTCHNTSAWQPATFNHDATFPLTGAHRSVACADCHPNNNYANTPRECSGCHMTDYTSANDPVHSPGFPTTCETCHTTTAWRPSTFNHESEFPIAAGTRHSPGRWNACSDCHIVPSDYSVFSCTDCHAHSDQTNVDSNHRGVSGYSFTPTSCYRCHPRG